MLVGALALVLALAQPTAAFWEKPHMIVAELAYRHLTPQVRERVDLILAQFWSTQPDQREWKSGPAAVWADEIKSNGNAFEERWHWKTHHFVDFDDDTLMPELEPDNTDNAGWAMSQALRTLKDGRGDAFSRAFALRMLLHIAGDSHQPCHATSRYDERLPGGDLGGNLFKLKDEYSPAVGNLHAFWDNAAGLFDDNNWRYQKLITAEGAQYISDKTDFVQSQRPRSSFSPEELLVSDPHTWLNESFEIAKEHVYRVCQDGQSPGDCIAYGETLPLESEYRRNAQDLLLTRIALGAYRLANVINSEMNTRITPELDPYDDGPYRHPPKGDVNRGFRTATYILAPVSALLMGVVGALLVVLLRRKQDTLAEHSPLLNDSRKFDDDVARVRNDSDQV
ncbi:MAG: hypothetical protein MHM6MM_003305 [Cercozoa sp. M6MM]